MLVLFDIDGTLLRTNGEGILAMQDAASELFARPCSLNGVRTAGSLDPLIWREICSNNGQRPTEELHDRFRALYQVHLRRRLKNRLCIDRMPGVIGLIEALESLDEVTLGLVTGNYPETGRLKIETAEIDFGVFKVFGWGCDGSHRRDLPPIAISQYEAHCGETTDHSDVVVIGDTPHDVDCALHNGCRVLAVATGTFDADALAESGASRVVADLSETGDLVGWITSRNGGRDG